MIWSLRCWPRLALVTLAVWTSIKFGSTILVSAEPPNAKPPFPWASPEDFFEQWFGKETPADQEALAKIDITRAEEQQFGDRAAQAYLAELNRQNIRVLARGKDVDYLQRLVATVQPSMKNSNRYLSIKVYVADSPEIDARCFPGGTLVFFRGLLDFAGSEAALVGVIGHELSHLDHSHPLNHLRRLKLAQQTFIGASQGFDLGRWMSDGLVLMRVMARPFRPEEEAAADLDGATWAHGLGYDPRQMGELFLRLGQRDKNRPHRVPALFRTHPFHMDRYRAIGQTYRSLQAQQPNRKLYVGQSNLRRRVTRDQREFND